MKTAVFYGTGRKGTTWRLTQALLRGLPEGDLREFWLPRDMDRICLGCARCIVDGEGACPHGEAIAPLLAALEEADLIVLSSPVYVMGMSAGMKAFCEHLACRWMVHRPSPSMFSKVGVAVSTAAGPCTGKTLRDLRQQFFYWGVARSFGWGEAVGGGWDYLKPERRRALERKGAALAGKVSAALARPRPSVKTRTAFSLMAAMERRGWSPGGAERAYWEGRGWLEGKRPW